MNNILKFCTLVIFLLLVLPATAGGPMANINIRACEYYDEYSREWHLVDSVSIEQLSGRWESVRQDCGGVASTELSMDGLVVNSEYRVEVKWVDGASFDETYTVFEGGRVDLWIEMPECY